MTQVNAANVPDDIYHAPKQPKLYKLQRLKFVNDKSFWTIWYKASFRNKKYIQLVYKLVTAMSLSRFTKPETVWMLIVWHSRHNFSINFTAFDTIIKDVNAFTLKSRRGQKRNEMRKYRATKKLHKTLSASSEVSNV